MPDPERTESNIPVREAVLEQYKQYQGQQQIPYFFGNFDKFLTLNSDGKMQYESMFEEIEQLHSDQSYLDVKPNVDEARRKHFSKTYLEQTRRESYNAIKLTALGVCKELGIPTQILQTPRSIWNPEKEKVYLETFIRLLERGYSEQELIT